MIELRIQQQFGRIDLRIIPFQYRLKIQNSVFLVEQRPAQITMEQPATALDIDYTHAREAIGYNGIANQQKVFNQEAKATSDAGIERRVLEGNELGDIRQNVSIAQIAEKASEPKQKNIELVSVPPVDIMVKIKPLRWIVKPGGVKVEFTPGLIRGEFQYGRVDVYLEQEPYVKVKAVGSLIDYKG